METSRNSVLNVALARRDALRVWIQSNAPRVADEQKHLDEGSAERAYWNFGYLSALQDLIAYISSLPN